MSCTHAIVPAVRRSVIAVAAGGLGLTTPGVLAQGDAPAPARAAPAGESDRTTYAFGPGRIHKNPEVLWPGFLSGLRGFEHFYEPIGNPIYFESPTPHPLAAERNGLNSVSLTVDFSLTW